MCELCKQLGVFCVFIFIAKLSGIRAISIEI